ncbi:UNVERIFIED_CONTAM: hypothetical protein PYX00_001077 [Menopon gallinae]|uniref:Sushi, von Willebrand factor type A, EGF and pentraxin domain-containing protein 1 n=1 Tax=Menopon gallinae TaxID=328185 RepID=A0AAW2ICP3_9NEOP
MIGSKARTCLPILQWNGLSTSCTVLNCPSLSLLKDGSIKPENCTAEGLRHDFATECSVSCRPGYRLEGPSLRNCTGRRGTWTGKNVPNKCIDIEPPVFTCPENITVETAEEESYALVQLSLPEGTDNSGLDPIIWSKPPFLPEYPLPLKIGITKIEVYGTDASDNGELCDFYVHVLDNEIPKVFNCESPPTFYMSDLDSADLDVNWTEPIFTDNSVTPLKIEKSHEFGNFSLGTTTVVYTATDASGNSVNCSLNITIEENPCKDHPSLGNVEWNCTVESNIMNCSLSCPPGLTWTTNNDVSDTTFMCQYDRTGAKWHPDIFSDLDTIPECSVFELPTEIVESHEIELDAKDIRCDDLEILSEDISNEISVLLGTDEGTKVSITADCVDEVEQNKTEPYEETNELPFRRRRNTEGKKIKIRVSLIGSSNKTNNEEVAKHIHELGEKVEKEYNNNTFISIGGKKLKVQKSKVVDTARLRCNPGFALKRGLCVKCPPGTFYSTSKSNCVPCPIGKYQNLEGQLHCESCPAGHLTRSRRKKQQKDCKKICPPGTFGKIKNPRRKLSLMPCTPCPIGTFQPSEGQTSCIDCPAEMTTTKKGSFKCIDRLEIEDPCYKFTCQNNGTCFVYNGYPYCRCPEGYLGSFCERQKNHCDSSPCYNNAECVPVGVTSFTCVCQKGYEGDLCQFDVNECASNPCANGGECIDLVNGYKCECPPGFSGDNCEEDINECEVFNNPCLNNGTCNDLVNSYSCTCQEGFTGKHCEEISECVADETVDKDCNTKIQKPVEEGPCTGVTCPDNMECTIAAGTRNLPLCKCKKGFYGRDCSQEINFNVILTFPKRSVTEYLTADFPREDIHQISVCLWIQTADMFNYGTLFSYAVKDDDNSFTITDYNGFVLYVRKERVVTDIIANDGHWHFICITWESEEGRWEIYLDGKMKGNGTGLAVKKPIPGRGRFIIGQEQDRFGGGFNEVESFVGKITNFDIWKRVLKKSEIEDMNENCKYFAGDLFSWVDFLENTHGNIEISKSTFCTNCNARELRLFKGKIRIENIRDSTFGVYECETGYRIHFEDEELPSKDMTVWYRKCLKNGNWEPTVPKCSRIQCGFPGYFPHGTISGESYLYSDVIEYRCDRGYNLVGNATRVCLENGTWSGDQPNCQGHSGFCEQILAPRHGSMFIYFGTRRKMHSSAIGDRAEFECDQGYRLRGPSTLTCSEEGLWDREVPVCEEISCNFPTEIGNLVLNSSSATSYATGEKLLIRCAESGEEEIIECLQNGVWNHTSGLCGTKCEGRPINPEHGLLLGDPLKHTYEPGETVGTKCRYGFRLIGDRFFTCTNNGTWYQRDKTICKPVECVKPFPPPNSYIASNFSTYPYGRRVLFKCLPGFKQLGDLLTRCDGEGNWTRLFGRCVAVYCRTPISTYDMRVTVLLYRFGDKLTFQCLNGRTPNSEEIICEGDGHWSIIPRCL